MLMNQPAPSAAPKDDLVSDTTTQTFVKDVIEESKKLPVLVDFWAAWCGPCKALTPVLEKVVRNAKGKVKLVKMNIDEHPAIPGQLGIQSIPAVFAFVNGQPVDGFLGALPESQVQAFVDRLGAKTGGGEEADTLRAADDLLAKGDASGAAEMYAHQLATEPENVRALAGLTRAHVKAGNLQPARATFSLIPPGKENDPAVSAARAALELAEQASKAGDPAALEEKVKANPADFQARLDLAVALNAHGRREEALAQLLEIIRRDRKWNDQAARKQLIQFFEAWGQTDPHTVEGRRRLSSILFS